MKDTLAEQGKPCTTISLSFDEFELGHVAFDHAVIDPPGEPSSHRLFVFLNSCGKGLEFREVTLVHLSDLSPYLPDAYWATPRLPTGSQYKRHEVTPNDNSALISCFLSLRLQVGSIDLPVEVRTDKRFRLSCRC